MWKVSKLFLWFYSSNRSEGPKDSPKSSSEKHEKSAKSDDDEDDDEDKSESDWAFADLIIHEIMGVLCFLACSKYDWGVQQSSQLKRTKSE